MLIKEIMTKKVDILNSDISLNEAARKMAKNNYGFLPVCDNEKFIGVLTDRDIVINAIAKDKNSEKTNVKDVMTDNVYYCYEDDEIEKATQLMKEKQIRRLIVLNKNKKIAGVVSLGDIVTKNKDKDISSNLIKAISED